MADLAESVKKSLARLNSKLTKKGADSVVMSPGSDSFNSSISYGISTQSFMLDLAIGRPGFPAGRLTEIAGLESSSKSTLALHSLAEVQRIGGVGVLIETENGFDASRAQNIGVNLDTLMIGQPETMESVFETIDCFIRDIRGTMRFKGPVLIVWDSVAATPVSAELEGEYGDALMGAHARVISKAMRKLIALVAHEGITLIFINQLKTDLKKTYGGESHVTFGGKAIRFAASIRIEVKRRKAIIGKDKNPTGIEVRISIVKNKIAPPFNKADICIGFKSGLDKGQDLLDAGLYMGIITEPSPGWFEYKGVKFQSASWRKVIKDKLGGGRKLLKEMYAYAYKEKWLIPYGESIGGSSTDEL